MQDLITYVIGGLYPTNRPEYKEFALVHPSHTKLPYVTHNPNSSTLRIGNKTAALYVVNLKEGKLIKQKDVHYELGETQPDFVLLTEEMISNIKEALKTQETYIA